MLAFLVMTFLLATPPTWAQAAVSPYRVISITGGTLTAQGQALKTGSRIALGKTIQVSGGAQAVIEASAGGRLLIIGPASFTPKSSQKFLLKAGRLLSTWKKLTSEFKIATPAIVAAVRGTEFFIETRGANETYLCVCTGDVEVFDPRVEEGGSVTVIKGDHHSGHNFKFSGSSFLQTDAAMTAHTDSDLENLRKTFR